jgi:microcystin-dependent protein
MFARLIHDLTGGRLRLPLRTGASTTKGDLRLDGRVPRLASNEPTTRDMRLLTDLDLGSPGNPPALREDGTLDPSVIPSATSTGGSTSSGGDLAGEIKAWAGQPLRVPTGWLVCDGSETLISVYPNLFAALGYQWGRPSNPTLYFKLPNLVGRTLIGGLGPNDSSQGSVHKINVRSPGANYIPGVYTGLSLIADTPASFSSPAVVRVTVGAGGGVDSVDIITAGAVSSVQPIASTTGETNCSIRIPVTSIPGGAGFTYDVYLAPISTAAQPWGIRVTDRGAGYTSTPDVVISGGSITGATAVAVLAPGGDVREIIVTNPGTGDPTGATVTLSGGGFSTVATAAILFWSSPAVPGDMGGEQQHQQLIPELAQHAHNAWHGNSFRQRDGGNGVFPNEGAISDLNGGDRPFNLRPPYAGVTYLIRAT